MLYYTRIYDIVQFINFSDLLF